MFGSPETTPGGRALKFYSSVRLDIRRIESIKDGVEVVGNRTRVKVVKNKVAPPFKQAEFDIMYGKGISREGSLLDIGVDLGIVKKSGAWYTYEGEQLGQGRENAKTFLIENPEIMVEISERIRSQVGIGVGDEADDGADDDDDDIDLDAAHLARRLIGRRHRTTSGRDRRSDTSAPRRRSGSVAVGPPASDVSAGIDGTGVEASRRALVRRLVGARPWRQLKVSTRSNPELRRRAPWPAWSAPSGAVEVQVVGAGALNQAIKAVAIARGYVAASGHRPGVRARPSPTSTIDGEDRTAIRLRIEDRSPRRRRRGIDVARAPVRDDPAAR